jgi:hypothetical protein
METLSREQFEGYLAKKRKLDAFFKLLAKQAAGYFRCRWNHHAIELSPYFGMSHMHEEFLAAVMEPLGFTWDMGNLAEDCRIPVTATLRSFDTHDDRIFVVLEWYIGGREYDFVTGEVSFDDIVLPMEEFDKKVKAEVAEKKKQFEYYVAENKAAEEAEAEKLERRELGRLKAKYEKGDDPDEAEERQRLSELKRKFDV